MGLLRHSVFGSVSGRIGGSVFSRNPGGILVRARTERGTPGKSPNQTQSDLYRLSKNAWNSFSDQEKSYWRSQAYLDGNNLSGYSYFLSQKLKTPVSQSFFNKISGVISRADILSLDSVPYPLLPSASAGVHRVILNVMSYPVSLPFNYVSGFGCFITSNTFLGLSANSGIFRSFVSDLNDPRVITRSYCMQSLVLSIGFIDVPDSGFSSHSNGSVNDVCYCDISGGGVTAIVNVTYGAIHGLVNGDITVISGGSAFDGTYIVTVLSPTSFSILSSHVGTEVDQQCSTHSGDLNYTIVYEDL